MKRILVFLFVVLTACPSCSSRSNNDSVTLREKIAQMLIVGFKGATQDEIEALEKEELGVRYYIQELGVGGVILFSQNVSIGTNYINVVSPDQVLALDNYLHGLSKKPLFIAVDQEGGRVARLNEQFGFPATVSAQHLGTQPIDSVRFYSEKTAKMLSELRINLNFAPCVDVNVNPNCPVIGFLERSFSSDTAKVVYCAKTWIEGHHKYKVLTAIKHFPGHGSSKNDSHRGMTDVTNTWQSYELAPYRELINSEAIDMVMTSHVFNRNLDSQYPASLSKNMIDGLLRKELGYNGVVVSDDMMMGAIAEHYSFENALQLSINAGCDILIISNNTNIRNSYNPNKPLEAIDIIENLVKSGKIPAKRIDESYERIMRMKSQL